MPVDLPPITTANPTARKSQGDSSFDARRAQEVSIVLRVFWRDAKQGSCLLDDRPLHSSSRFIQSWSRSNGSIVAECCDDKTSRLA